MSETILNYYRQHSPITDPKEHVAFFENLPTDLPALHQVIQNVLIHNWKIRKFHPHLLVRAHEYEIRRISPLLTQILEHENQPLTSTRPTEKLTIVDCRHFATLLCAILRHQGTPARVRCGFASYLEETHYQDHWICEYWNGARWVMEDPDLTMHDVPPDKFITAGRAWRMCRNEGANPYQFGYSPEENEKGWWPIRHDVIRDLASLNKFEALSSDVWGLMDKEESDVSSSEKELIDQAAALTTSLDSSFEAMRAFYPSQTDLSVPTTIKLYNYVNDTMRIDDVSVELGLIKV